MKLLIALAVIGVLIVGYQYSKPASPEPAPAQPAPATVANHSDPSVDLVRAGSLPGFASMTVGKAFGDKFQNARWNSFQTPNGVSIVDFSGTIRSGVLSVAGLTIDGLNPIILRSNCITSLGLGAKMSVEARSVQTFEDAASESGVKHYAPTAASKQQQPEKELSDASEAKIQACMESLPIPVKFQFIVSADRKTFELAYIDAMPFGKTPPDRVLAFIYH